MPAIDKGDCEIVGDDSEPQGEGASESRRHVRRVIHETISNQCSISLGHTVWANHGVKEQSPVSCACRAASQCDCEKAVRDRRAEKDESCVECGFDDDGRAVQCC